MDSIVKLFRPHQYIKNIFIFAPLLFSLTFEINLYLNALVAFIFFSLIASSIYIFNDLMDIEADRLHPKKRFRPIANGKITKKNAYILLLSLSIPSLIGASFFSLNLFIILIIYFLLNIIYSLKLKHIAIIDIFIISTGFVLRLFAGAVVTNIGLSSWIIIITFLLALFLAMAKRRDDVLLSLKGEKTRKNIDGYNLEFINASMVLMAGVVIVSYLLYTLSPEITARVGNEYLFLTSFFIILGVLRYMQITFVEQNSGSPTKIVLKDLFLQITILFWLISFVAIVKFL